MRKFIADETQKLKDFTDAHYPQGSFAYSRLLRDRDIRVNGVRTRENAMLSAGDEIAYYTTAAEEAKPFYREVYADENVLIADKFSGVQSEALFFALQERGARPVHRLDRNTAGLIAFALNEEAEGELIDAFRRRDVDKIYEAICFHPFQKERGELIAYLKKDEKASHVTLFSKPVAGAGRIRTDYEVRENYGEYSLVNITLHSGKTHQIRAHMAFIGHPVAGDEKYGDRALNAKYHVKRQLLVAKKLCFHTGGALTYLSGKEFESSFSARMPH